MNNTLATLAVFLVAAMFLSQVEANYVCCFAYTINPIPLNKLKSYEYTAGRCSLPAVIFTTQKNRRICVDPNEKWVQDRITNLSPN